MPKNINRSIFPFNEKQLAFFRKEIDDAGGFEELMVRKGALNIDGEVKRLNNKTDAEEYIRKFIIGGYESLKEFFDTDVPYSSWSLFYETLLKAEGMEEE